MVLCTGTDATVVEVLDGPRPYSILLNPSDGWRNGLGILPFTAHIHEKCCVSTNRSQHLILSNTLSLTPIENTTVKILIISTVVVVLIIS